MLKLLFLLLSTLIVDAVNLDLVVSYINSARTNPQAFSTMMEQYYTSFSRYKWNIRNQEYLTNEGVSAVYEAIQVLNSETTAMGSLTRNVGLDTTAQVQANYLMAQSKLPSNPFLGCNGENVGQRVTQAGTWVSVGESIIGGVSNEEDIAVMLLVSDGDAYRVDRSNLLNPAFSSIGLGIMSNGAESNLVVIQFASSYNCNHNQCPVVPQEQPFYCDWQGFTYFSLNLQVSLSLIVIVSTIFMILT